MTSLEEGILADSLIHSQGQPSLPGRWVQFSEASGKWCRQKSPLWPTREPSSPRQINLLAHRLAPLPPCSAFPNFLPRQSVGPPEPWQCSDGHIIRVEGMCLRKEVPLGSKAVSSPASACHFCCPQDPGVT